VFSFVFRRALRPAAAVFGAGALVLSAAPAHAVAVQPTPSSTAWGTNGRVTEILPVPGGQVVIAGSFTALTDPAGGSHPAGHIALLDASGAQVTSWAASTDGEVDALATRGGTLYIGGAFGTVDGQAHRRLAAVNLSTGALLPSFTATTTNGQVSSLAVTSTAVFVAGTFTSLKTGRGTVARSYVAKLDPTSGAVDAGWAVSPDARVRSVLASPDSSKVYLGGDFVTVSGTDVRYDAAVSTAAPATVLPFRLSWGQPVIKQTISGGVLYLAIGGNGGACGSYNATTGTAYWIAGTDGNVQAVTVADGIAYCGGHFAHFGGAVRQHIAAVSIASPALSSWAPVFNSALGVWALANDGANLFAGGDFTKAGSRPRAHLASFAPVP
jgi:hypothetical protein